MSFDSVTDPHSVPPPTERGVASSNRFNQWIKYYVHSLGLNGKGSLLLFGVLLVAWLSAGIYKVQPDEQGVVLRFGRWVETAGPGLHYHLPYPIESVLLPKVTQVNQLRLGKSRTVDVNGNEDPRERQILTGDENILEAECAVFWKIKDAGQFLFKINNPQAAIKIAAESALREVVSRTPIQAAMSDKRQQIADQTRALMQTLLDRSNSGVLITQVQLQRVDPPGLVIDAFNDVQRAKADQERARNEAESYANDILPRARGEASRITEEAEAYKAQAVNLAQGDAQGFLLVYNSYTKARDVTAWRLYLESIDEVLKKATRVIIDTSGKSVGGIVPFIQLDEKNKAASKSGPK
jgi:membrane protease subunit HflK